MTGLRAPAGKSSFRRVAIALLVFFFMVGLNAVQDYREARRVSVVLDRLQSAGVPTGLKPPLPASAIAGDSGALYAAAALLTGSRAAVIDRVAKVAEAEMAKGPLTKATLAQVGEMLGSQRDIFDLIDRAGTQPFSGFAAGTLYGYQTFYMAELYRLASQRSVYLASSGNATDATSALLSELALFRSAGSPLGDGVLPDRFPTAEHIALAVSQVSSAQNLQALASAVQAADDDAALARQLDRRRAQSIERFVGRARYGAGLSWDSLVRPWAAGAFLRNLDLFGEKAATVRRPWPDRLDVAQTPTSGTARWFSNWVGEPAGLPNEAILVIARDVAAMRAAAMVVAVERYRLAHGGAYPASADELVPQFITSLPIDPYSGKPMRFLASANDYTVYSIGPDRTDNNGAITGAAASGFAGSSRQARAPAGDIGLRIAKSRQTPPRTAGGTQRTTN